MSNKHVLMIGAGGHARAVFDVIKSENRYRMVGLIDSFQKPGTICFGCTVLGEEADIPRICSELNVAHVVIAIGDNFQRQAMANRIKQVLPIIKLISTVHPSAVISSDVKIGDGTVIMPGVTIISGSSIAEGCVLNTASSLDHDGRMDSWSSLGPGVITGGYLRLGERASICLGSVVKDRISIGRDTVVGMGAVVTRNMPDNVLAYGAPCRIIRSRKPDESYM